MTDQQPHGIMQATGHVATSIVQGLVGQPVLIFLLVLNCIVFGLFAYAGSKRTARDMLILERCLPRLHSDANGTTTGGFAHE